MSIDIAKKYLEENHPLMNDANLEVHPHDTTLDYALVPHLESHGIDENHIDDDPQHIVVATKNFVTEDGAEIPKIFKIKVKDGQVASVLESK